MTKVNLFNNAKSLETKEKSRPLNKPKDILLPGLKIYTAVCIIEKAVRELRGELEKTIQKKANQHFIKKSVETKTRPDNFLGYEDIVTASTQLKIRSSNSPLTKEERKTLREAGVPVEKVSFPISTFVLNPEYAKNKEVMDLVNSLLVKDTRIPVNLFMKQESDTQYIVSTATLVKTFKLPADKLSQILPIVTNIVFRPTWNGPSPVSSAIKTLMNYLNPKKDKD